MNIPTNIFALASVLLLSATISAQAPLTVDATASKVVWTGTQITGPHSGTINVADGQVEWSTEGLAGATMTLDMSSIKNTDMKEELAAKLEGHLKSADFFNAAEFKTATFQTTDVSKIDGAESGKPNYTVTGDLTIKGITKPITFDVLAWRDGKTDRVAGNAVFNRAHYDVRHGSASFFNDIGDKMIEDNVELTFDLTSREK